MNDHIETEVGIWTADVRRFVKHADWMSLEFVRITGGYSRTFSVTATFKRKRNDGVEEALERRFAGQVYAGYRNQKVSEYDYERSEDNQFDPEKGFWSTSIDEHARSCLRVIPIGATVLFRVSLDNHTSGLLTEASLHADVLTAVVRKGKSLWHFDLDQSICAHNTARFGHRW